MSQPKKEAKLYVTLRFTNTWRGDLEIWLDDVLSLNVEIPTGEVAECQMEISNLNCHYHT